MFGWFKDLDLRIKSLAHILGEDEKSMFSLMNSHKICASCGITGHTIDMKEVWDYTNGHVFFHNSCYAEKFNKHLCSCKCGKWIENKKTKCNQ